MNLYSADQQENIFIRKKGRDLLRSRLITRGQYQEILSLTNENLKQAGFFFRLLYFVFSLVFIFAVLGYFVWLFQVRGTLALAFVFILFGAGAYAVAEWLVGERRLYRYGLEEGFVIGAASLFVLGLYFGLLPFHPQPEQFTVITSLAGGAIYYWAYKRFGFLYAAFLSLYYLVCLPFQLHWSELPLRLSLIVFFGALFYLNLWAERRSEFAYQRENNRLIQAVLFLGVYFAVNAALFPSFLRPVPLPPLFYWSCFVLTFIVPGTALYFGFQDKNRAFIDAGLITSIISLATIKLFFSLPYQAWDPVILGLVLIGAALAAKRSIDLGELPGYTAKDIMNPETHGLDLLTATLTAPNLPGPPGGPQFSGGGSGGAGASRRF